jgi:hypothetical protein
VQKLKTVHVRRKFFVKPGMHTLELGDQTGSAQFEQLCALNYQLALFDTKGTDMQILRRW